MTINNIGTDETITYPLEEARNKINFTLSFDNFLDKLKAKLEKDSQETELDTHWLHELTQHMKWLDGNRSADYSSYQRLFDFIQQNLLAPVQGKDLMWGVIQPIYPYCIHATAALSGLLEQDLQVRLKPGVYVNCRSNSHLVRKIVFYSFVLQKLYGFTMNNNIGMVARIGNPETEVTQYFRFEIDTSYLEIRIEGQLPHLKIEDIFERDAKGTLFDYLEEALPFKIFSITGFASVRVIKDTTHSILEEIRAAITYQTTDSIVDTTKMVLKMLKSLVQNGAIQFGLLPFLKLNGKLINFDLAGELSIVLNTSYAKGISNEEILNQMEIFNKHPRLLIIERKSGANNSLLQGVFEQGRFETIVLLPIYHQSLLVGHLEIATASDREVTKQIDVFALEQAMPLLAELVYRDNMEFNNQIRNIVQARFTSIHPSVLWKMNEAAFVYLRDVVSKPEQAVISDIVFEQVYPLCGAVDIRNSTAIRNKATSDDLTIQLIALVTTLREINNEVDSKIVDAKLCICRHWLEVLKRTCTAEIELNIYSFIESEINPLLTYYRQNFPQLSKSILRYYETIDPQTGSSGLNRRAIEQSMHIINHGINSQIETFGNRLQELYPSYFDSFRTDGVEYDIYLGQSIAPNKTFDNHYLHEYRLLQLISMAEIARNTHSLLPTMEVPLQTTQLIFTSNRPIDINFRSDEKRFDVEGSHNIRYQMIKKRIDKVYIKGTEERLTQPGKIAIVFLDAEIKQEYKKYISYGQQQGYFREVVEFLDLEELQDVSGLKAIRVSVRL